MSKTKTSHESSLFAHGAKKETPLAERLRPTTMDEFVGQARVVDGARFFRETGKARHVPSLILWGPPGCGKTTLARILAASVEAKWVAFSAVLGNLAELREIVAQAKEERDFRGGKTMLFVDEIHRFNKSQQDAFLPHVEAGTITLLGATTENPSFAVNAALLSRCKVFRLEPLPAENVVVLLQRALTDEARGLGKFSLTAEPDVFRLIAEVSAGDARRALTTLEVLAMDTVARGARVLTEAHLREVLSGEPLRHDKSGEDHYNVTSAFIKSMRGSDPDAAMYWMMRLLEAGEDPLFVLRRMIIFASEDIGLADSRALMVATAADDAFRRLGMPEGMYPLAHAVTYLACAPKSNAVNVSWHRAKELVERYGALSVPLHLRNAPTKLMKAEGYGVEYKYAHDHGGLVLGETYVPDEVANVALYEPTERGEEAKIKPRVDAIRAARKKDE